MFNPEADNAQNVTRIEFEILRAIIESPEALSQRTLGRMVSKSPATVNRLLKDLEGKLSDSEKQEITDAKDQLQAVLNNGTVDQIKEKTEALTEKFHIISTKLYQLASQQAGAQGQGFDPNMGAQGFNGAGAGFDPNNFTGGQQAGPANDDNVVDADYTVVDEDK